jgi:hypothetical protein
MDCGLEALRVEVGVLVLVLVLVFGDLLGRRTNGDKYRLVFGAEQGIGLGFGQSESEVRRCRILRS